MSNCRIAFPSLLIGAASALVAAAGQAQEVTVSTGGFARPSAMVETVTGQCGSREIKLVIERPHPSSASSAASATLSFGGSRIDLEAQGLGRDLVKPGLSQRYFVLCRQAGFTLSGFGYRSTAEDQAEGVHFLAAFDVNGQLESYTGLLQRPIDVVVRNLP
jgi:hypothetical protein